MVSDTFALYLQHYLPSSTALLTPVGQRAAVFGVGSVAVVAATDEFRVIRALYHRSPVVGAVSLGGALAPAASPAAPAGLSYVVTLESDQIVLWDGAYILGAASAHAVAAPAPAAGAAGARALVALSGQKFALLIHEDGQETLDIAVIEVPSLNTVARGVFHAGPGSVFSAAAVDDARLGVLVGGAYRLFDVAGAHISELYADPLAAGVGTALAAASGWIAAAGGRDLRVFDERGQIFGSFSPAEAGFAHDSNFSALAPAGRGFAVGETGGGIALIEPAAGGAGDGWCVKSRLLPPAPGPVLALAAAARSALTCVYGAGLTVTYAVTNAGLERAATGALPTPNPCEAGQLIAATSAGEAFPLYAAENGTVYEFPFGRGSTRLSTPAVPMPVRTLATVAGAHGDYVVGLTTRELLAVRRSHAGVVGGLVSGPLPATARPPRGAPPPLASVRGPAVQLANGSALLLSETGVLLTLSSGKRRPRCSVVHTPGPLDRLGSATRPLAAAGASPRVVAVALAENNRVLVPLLALNDGSIVSGPGVGVPQGQAAGAALHPSGLFAALLVYDAVAVDDAVVYIVDLSVPPGSAVTGRLELSGRPVSTAVAPLAFDASGLLLSVLIETEVGAHAAIIDTPSARVLAAIGPLPAPSSVAWKAHALTLVFRDLSCAVWAPSTAVYQRLAAGAAVDAGSWSAPVWRPAPEPEPEPEPELNI